MGKTVTRLSLTNNTPTPCYSNFSIILKNALPKVLIFLLVLASRGRVVASDYKMGDRTKVFTERLSGDSIVVKASNSLPIPVTIKLNFGLTNLKIDSTSTLSTVLEGGKVGQVLALLTRADTNLTSILTYKWRVTYGDTSKTPNQNLRYVYPFKNWSYRISQGPDGDFSHKGMFAFDFAMPEGTPVTAVRAGIVAITRSDSEQGGPTPDFTDEANFISVYHTDGTIATYCHLKKDGVVVKEGDLVKQGEVIGFSGNTGFSSGPHLHFEITQPDLSSDRKKWVKFKWKEAPDYLTASNPIAALFFKNFYYYQYYYSKSAVQHHF